MTASEQAGRLCALYSTLPEMNHENLVYRIGYEALGKSDPAQLADKLLQVSQGKAKADPKAPEDEAIWVAAMLKLASPQADGK
jgi:hypothetical protein